MKPQLDDLTGLTSHAGLDPRTITLEQILALIIAEARGRAGRAMAAVKLGKAPLLVTREEAEAALEDWVTVGNEALTGQTMRAGESAFISALRERGLYDRSLSSLRHATNRDLDLGEVTVMGKPWPTKKRPSGRPGSSERFAKMLATLIWFTIGSGEAGSVESAISLLTTRDRTGKAIGAGPPRLALPNSNSSHWTVRDRLKWAAQNVPELIEDARRQGEIARAGGTVDESFRAEFADICAILGNRKAVERMLRAAKRENLTKTPEKSSQTPAGKKYR